MSRQLIRRFSTTSSTNLSPKYKCLGTSLLVDERASKLCRSLTHLLIWNVRALPLRFYADIEAVEINRQQTWGYFEVSKPEHIRNNSGKGLFYCYWRHPCSKALCKDPRALCRRWFMIKKQQQFVQLSGSNPKCML